MRARDALDERDAEGEEVGRGAALTREHLGREVAQRSRCDRVGGGEALREPEVDEPRVTLTREDVRGLHVAMYEARAVEGPEAARDPRDR